MLGLTDRQQKVLDFIRSEIASKGIPPTLREIGAHMGIVSTNGVNDHLRCLERKGYLSRHDMVSRGIKLTAKGEAAEVVTSAIPSTARETIAAQLERAGVVCRAGSPADLAREITIALERAGHLPPTEALPEPAPSVPVPPLAFGEVVWD